MTTKDDFNDMFLASGVADLDWLNMDKDAYQQLDTLPKQNLDIQPDLAAMWDHSDKPQNVGVDTHFYQAGVSARDIKETAKDRDLAAASKNNVVRFATELLLNGASPTVFVSKMKGHFAKEDLFLAKMELSKLSQEIGLLGRVYVSSEIYPHCYVGEGKEIIQKSKTAKLLLKKESCDGCVYNQNSNCAIYKKTLVARVNYTHGLVKEFQALHQCHGKTSSLKGKTPRDQLQYLNLHASEKPSMPVHRESVKQLEPKVSMDEALTQLRNRSERRVVAGVSNDRLYRNVALKMMTRKLSSELRAKIATVSHTRLNILKANEDLVGNVWVDLGAFDNCEVQAKAFLAKHAHGARFVTKTIRCGSCSHFHDHHCGLFDRDIVASGQDVPYSVNLTKDYIRDYLSSGRISEKVAATLIKGLASQKSKSVLAAMFRYQQPVKSKIYEGQVPERKAVSETELVNYLREETRRSEEQRKAVDLSERTYEPVLSTIRSAIAQGLNGPLVTSILREKFEPGFLRDAQPVIAKKLASEGLLEKLRGSFDTHSEVIAWDNPVESFDLQPMLADVNAETKYAGDLDFELTGEITIDE